MFRVKSPECAELWAWAKKLKQRTSHKKAVVALARKLAVVMHAIWKDGTEFELKGTSHDDLAGRLPRSHQLPCRPKRQAPDET